MTQIDRRQFLLTAGALLAAPLAGNAQPSGTTPRVGYVAHPIRSAAVTDAFELGLRELGYANGRNIVVEYRTTEGRIDRLPAAFEELLRLRVNVLLASAPYAIRAARQATSTVPIVGVDLETDPIQAGWAKSLARPGGNLTGFFLDIPEMGSKLLQFVSEAVPRLQRIAVLWDAQIASSQFKATEAASRSATLKLQSLPFREPEEFVAAFEAARNQKAQALIVLSSPLVFVHRQRLADLALQYRLPAISLFPQFADAGGLLGYGPNVLDLFRRAAGYVDRILKGAKPADLPIQRPTVFELAINVKTAKALGLTIPQNFLVRADRVIE